jgi:hypothetical protein
MAVRFVPNPAFRRELESERPFKQGMGETTIGLSESIKIAAEPYRHTGNFIRRVGPSRAGRGFSVEIERFFGHIIELGSVNNAPQRNVLRGALAAGMRFHDDGAKRAE